MLSLMQTIVLIDVQLTNESYIPHYHHRIHPWYLGGTVLTISLYEFGSNISDSQLSIEIILQTLALTIKMCKYKLIVLLIV